MRDDVWPSVSQAAAAWNFRLAKMAEALSTDLGEEKEKEDSEREKKAATAGKNKEKDGVTETLGFNDKNGASGGKKNNLSGES